MIRLFRDVLARARRDEHGGSAVLFALSLPVVIGVLGGAVDFASLSQQRSSIQSLTDATALSIARQMTMMRMTDTQLQSAAEQFAVANGAASGLKSILVTTTPSTDRLAVSVVLSAAAATPLGIAPALVSVTKLEAKAQARVGQQSKLCLLSLSDTPSNEFVGGMFVTPEKTGIDIRAGARLKAPDCLIQTNIAGPAAMRVASGATVTAAILCAVGGIQNAGGTVEAAVIDSCPRLRNPMDSRPYPNVGQNCETKPYKDIVLTAGTHVLNAGNYCGNITISGDAKVRLSPGTFAIQGKLTVSGNAELTGTNVGLYLWGGKASKNAFAKFAFLENALIDLSGPETGPMAGFVIWEGINGAAFDLSSGVANTNFHQISTARARRLNGTIYLPGGRLLIDAPVRVAEESDYTVLVVNRLDLAFGPMLVLNSNYAKSRVPVPDGYGPIGARNVRLVQ
ncbi:MAG: pilus assembly protein [Beijerinckiaceae bacterium]|nr:pilus assembly protein [Beijerinckiaceae bacterium]